MLAAFKIYTQNNISFQQWRNTQKDLSQLALVGYDGMIQKHESLDLPRPAHLFCLSLSLSFFLFWAGVVLADQENFKSFKKRAMGNPTNYSLAQLFIPKCWATGHLIWGVSRVWNALPVSLAGCGMSFSLHSEMTFAPMNTLWLLQLDS